MYVIRNQNQSNFEAIGEIPDNIRVTDEFTTYHNETEYLEMAHFLKWKWYSKFTLDDYP